MVKRNRQNNRSGMEMSLINEAEVGGRDGRSKEGESSFYAHGNGTAKDCWEWQWPYAVAISCQRIWQECLQGEGSQTATRTALGVSAMLYC